MPRSLRLPIAAVLAAVLVAEGAVLLLRPRDAGPAPRAVSPHEYFTAAQLDRAVAFRDGQTALFGLQVALGLAVLAAVANGRTDGFNGPPAVALTEGFQAAFLVGALLAIVGAVLSAVLIRSRDSREHRDAALAGQAQPAPLAA